MGRCLRNLFQLLWFCRISLLSVVIGYWLLAHVAQVQDLFIEHRSLPGGPVALAPVLSLRLRVLELSGLLLRAGSASPFFTPSGCVVRSRLSLHRRLAAPRTWLAAPNGRGPFCSAL
jgi:hypothetical protein